MSGLNAVTQTRLSLQFLRPPEATLFQAALNRRNCQQPGESFLRRCTYFSLPEFF